MRRLTALRLAEHVAHTVHVDAMLDAMTPQQFDEWCAKDRIEPISQEATRHVLAMIGALLANFAGNKRVKPEHFLPWLCQTKEPMTARQIRLAAAMIPGARHGVRR